jgi:hypothetical protein
MAPWGARACSSSCHRSARWWAAPPARGRRRSCEQSVPVRLMPIINTRLLPRTDRKQRQYDSRCDTRESLLVRSTAVSIPHPLLLVAEVSAFSRLHQELQYIDHAAPRSCRRDLVLCQRPATAEIDVRWPLERRQGAPKSVEISANFDHGTPNGTANAAAAAAAAAAEGTAPAERTWHPRGSRRRIPTSVSPVARRRRGPGRRPGWLPMSMGASGRTPPRTALFGSQDGGVPVLPTHARYIEGGPDRAGGTGSGCGGARRGGGRTLMSSFTCATVKLSTLSFVSTVSVLPTSVLTQICMPCALPRGQQARRSRERPAPATARRHQRAAVWQPPTAAAAKRQRRVVRSPPAPSWIGGAEGRRRGRGAAAGAAIRPCNGHYRQAAACW